MGMRRAETEGKFNNQLIREIHRVIYTLISHCSDARPLEQGSLDTFFNFLLALEAASLIQKKDILNAFSELFECS